MRSPTRSASIALGDQAGRPDRAGRRDRPRVRRLLLRRGLCRRLAGAAAAADQLRRPRILCRPARGPAQQLRSRAVPLSRRSWPNSARGAAAKAGIDARDWESLADFEPAAAALPTAKSGRHRLSAIFERIDPLPARRRGHPPGAARQSPRSRHRPRDRRHRPLHLLAALVSRHGPGRLLPVADRAADVGRLSEDRGFRPPAARLARHDHPQPRHDAQLFADLRLRHLLAADELADARRGPLRPVALADRRQWRRHDPP